MIARRHLVCLLAVLLISTLLATCLLLRNPAFVASLTMPLPNEVPARIWSYIGRDGVTEEEEEVPDEGDPSLKYSQRVVAIGSLYSDYSATLRTLRMAGLVDVKGTWFGRRSVVVFTGNTLGYGKDTIALQRYLKGLRTEASRTGGGVVVLLGKHEVWNSLGDWDRTSQADFSSFGGERQRQFALSASGSIGQGFLTDFLTTARVAYTQWYTRPTIQTSNDTLIKRPRRLWSQDVLETIPPRDGFSSAAALFVSSGLAPTWTRDAQPLASINSIAHSLLEKLIAYPLQRYVEVPAHATADEKRLASRTGPLWYSAYVSDTDEVKVCADVARVLDKTQAARIITGNNGSARKLLSRCSGKVIMLNNISPARQGTISAVEISYNLQGRHLNATHTRLKESETVLELREGQAPRLLVRSDRRQVLERLRPLTYGRDGR